MPILIPAIRQIFQSQNSQLEIGKTMYGLMRMLSRFTEEAWVPSSLPYYDKTRGVSC